MKLENIINQNFNKSNFISFIKESLNATFVDATLHEVENDKYISSYQRVAYTKLHKDSIDFFIFEAKNKNIDYVRVGFNKFISSLVPAKYSFDGAIVAIFHPKSDTWRLSFVNIEFTDANKKELKTKPQRYTFEIGKNIVQKTALEQLGQLPSARTIKDLQDIFSVERVSNKFFDEYKKLYFDLMETLKPEIALFYGSDAHLRLFAKKLLGRIVFLYFLQKKGWLGSKKEWGDGDREFLNKLYHEYTSYDNANDFYGDILNPLFFRALNSARENDYFKPLECKIPFLNGGLFTPSKFDEDSKQNPVVMLSNEVFKNIFDTFSSYNFTIIEDTPHESEVAIDPEMLGRVFEDLLEDRKEKGAFYTPREIVHFMAKRSIHNHLESELKEYSYLFNTEEFLEKTTLSDSEILNFYEKHPIKFIKIENYFTLMLPYKSLVVDFYMVTKLRGLLLNSDGTRTKKQVHSKGHPEVTAQIWSKILKKEYKPIGVSFGSSKEIRLKKSYKYPTILKYIQIDEQYFALAFLPNIWGDLELTTIFPMRYKNIQKKLKKLSNSFEDISKDNFVFNGDVYEDIKELREDCRSLYAEPLQDEGELPRQAVVQKGLSAFHNSFKINSITNFTLKAFLRDKDYYNQTINKLLNNSTLSQDKLKDIMKSKLRAIKVLDPAIGSGAFPMGVLHEIVDARLVLGDTTPLSQMKREIIENNIYGIDIEESAVEIAKLRFWLSIVVDEVEPKPLPNLFYKIMVGNSLIETANGFDLMKERKKGSKAEQIRVETLKKLDEQFRQYYDEHNKHKKDGLRTKINLNLKTLFDEGLKKYSKQLGLIGVTKQEMQEAKTANLIVNILHDMYKNHYSNKIFLYKMFFKEVMDRGGFDLIIGNPPYIMEDENKQAFEGLHQLDCYQGKTDIWHIFTCKAIELLKENASVSFIAKNQWFSSASASKMRASLYKNTELKYIIDFGSNLIFENADVQTMMFLATKNKNNKTHNIKYIKFEQQSIEKIKKKLENYNLKFEVKSIDKNYDASHNLTFSSLENEIILTKIDNKKNFEFDAKKEIIQGIIGAPDKAFIVKKNELNKFNIEEKEYIKMLHTNTHKYFTKDSDKYIIYIHKNNFSDKNINNFFNIKDYFKANKKLLIEKKISYKTPNKPYYYLHRERNEEFFKDGAKIIFASRSRKGDFAYTEKAFYGSRNLFFIKSSRINLKYMTALLNSTLIYFYMSERLKHTGELLQIDKNQFMKIPIYSHEDTKPFETLVDKIIKLKEKKEETQHLEDEIDALVYKLYDLSPKEIQLIQESTNR